MAENLYLQNFKKLQQQLDKNNQQAQTSITSPFGVGVLDDLFKDTVRKAYSAGSADPLGDAFQSVSNYRNTVRKSYELGAQDPLGTALNRYNDEMTQKAYQYSTQGITDYAGLKSIFDQNNFLTKTGVANANRQRALDVAMQGYVAPVDEETTFWENLPAHAQTAMTNGITALDPDVRDRYLDFSGTDEWRDIVGNVYRWEDLTPDQKKGIEAYAAGKLNETAVDRQRRTEDAALEYWHNQNPLMKWASENAGQVSDYADFYSNLGQYMQTVQQGGYEALPKNVQQAAKEYLGSVEGAEYADAIMYGKGLTDAQLAGMNAYGAEKAKEYQAASEIYQPYAPTAYQQYLEQQMRRTPEGAQEWLNEAMGTEDEQAAKDNLYFVENGEKYNAYGTDGTFDPSITDKMYLYVNDAEGAREAADSFFMQADGVSTNPFYALRQMEPYEVGRYNKIAKEAGVDAANAYINDYLMYDLDARANADYAKDIYANAQKNGWNAAGMSAVSVLTSLVRGVNYLDVAGQKLFNGDKPVNYDRTAGFGIFTDATRQGVMDSVDWTLTINGKDWDVFDFIYGAGMSTLDSVVSSMAGPWGGAALLAAGAAQSTMQDVHARGGSDAEALLMGAASGAFELIFEEISLSKFLKTSKVTNLNEAKKWLKNLGINAITNSSEEFLTELANIVLDISVMGEKSQAYQDYLYYTSMGLTETEAMKKVASELGWQLGEAAMSGLVQGVGMGFAADVGSANYTQKSNKNAGTSIITNEGKNNLKNLATSMPEGSNARKMALEFNPETAKAKETGQLFREIIKELPKEMRGSVTENFAMHAMQSLQEKGETANSAEVAIGLAKVVSGQELSESEYQALAKSDYGIEMMHELLGANEVKQEQQKPQKQHKPIDTAKQALAPELKGETAQEEAAEDKQSLQIDADGEVTMVGNDGKRVAVEDAGLQDDETVIIHGTAKFGDAASKAAMEAWNAEKDAENTTPTDAKGFASGFNKAFQAALEGKTEADVVSSPAVSELSESARKAAWKAGEAARIAAQEKQTKANAARAKADGFRTTQEAGEDAGVSYAGVTKKISAIAKKQLQLIDSWAKELGLRVHVFDSLDGGNANGKLTKGSNVISLALDAEGGLLTRTASHESYHFIESWNKDAAQKLQDFVVNTLKSKEGYDLQKEIDAKIKQYADNGIELTTKEATREIVADSVLDIIGTEENVRKLLQQDKTLAAKVSEVLKRIMEKMRAMMQKLGWQSAEVKALQHDMDYIENIQQMMADALKTASENYANAQYKASELAKKDSAVAEYITDMKKATSTADAQAALNGMVSDMFMRAEKGWLSEHPDADLDESLQKFADALKTYKRGEMALENALKRAGFDAQPYEMNSALSYAGTQLLRAEAKGQGGDVQYQVKQVNYTPDKIEENITFVANMKPVKALIGNEFTVGGTDLRANVSAYFAQIGGSVYNEELGDIELSKRGVKDSLGHGMGPNKAAAFAAVKEVLENGKVIDFEVKWKGRDYDTAVVAAPITIKGENYYMGVVVRRSNVQRYYLHEVLLKKQNEIGNRSTEASGQASGSSYGGTNLDINSVLEKLNSVNTENSGTVKQQAEELSDKDTQWSIRKEAPPKNTIKGYKVFVVFKNRPGQLYPPMVANPGGESTPVGVWLNADVGVQAPDSKTGRKQVKAGGKGTQGGSGSLAFRPGWHLGDMPKATQFNRLNPETGVKELFPENFVWAECECAADHDYQEEAMSYGYNANGKFQHSLAGLPRLPREEDGTAGYYRYRTNPNPDTVPWIITGAMKVNRILDDAETEAILRENGIEPMQRVGGPIDLAKYGLKAGVVGEAEETLEKNGIELLNDDTATAQHSFKTYTKNERAKMLDALVMAGFERESAEKWLEDLDSVSAKIGADRERLDFEAADNHTMLKKNSEYRYTVDASTLCKKRLLYQGTFNAIQHQLPKRMISSDELLELLTMMRDMGYETPCGICYVESMRRHLGRYAQRWLDDYRGSYIPSLDEVTTSDGLEKLRHDHPQTYDDFTKAMKKLGTANPKLVQLRTEYKGEIRTRSQRVIDYLNKHGGLRVQSYSDFEIYNALDMMQVFVDMAARGLKSQAYTKVPEYARIFGKTGQKINLSLIAEGSGLDANGNLIFSPTEGMDINTALEIRKNNSANVGTIIVGTSKEHILKCMADDRIDFIIPFHRSGWGQHEMEMMGIGMYEDFTKWQNEKHLVNGRNVKKNFDPSEYWDFSKTGKENAEAYLKKCAAEGRIPKFSNFLVDNGDGSYSLQPDGSTDGYWKTLIDFKMYDNSGKGSPQVAVQPNFNMREVNRILKAATGTASQLPVAQDVVDRFVQKLENDSQYSLKKADIAKSVEEDAALYTQVKSDSDIADAVGLVRRLYYTLRRGDSYTQEGANIPPQEDGAWENRLDKVVNQLLSETGSKYGKIKLKKKLKALYTAMDTNGADTGEMMVYAREIAMALLEEAPGVVNEMDESTKEILQVLKNNAFYLTDDMKSEIRATQGSVADYRRKNFGKMKIRAKAGSMSSLADVWEETLNPLRPDVFTLDATEADMPIILDAFLETANEKTYSSYFEGNLDQYATDMALSIILEYYDLPGMANQTRRMREELQEKQQEIRANYKQKYENRLKASRERKEATEDRQKMRKKIIKMVRSMNSRLLTNSDTKHIPQELKGAVSAMIRPFLDETGVFTGPELRAILHQYSLLAEGGKNQDIEAAYAYDPDIQEKIEKVADTMAGRRLSQLTLEELTDLRDIVGNLNKIIFEQNEIQVKGRKMSLLELGNRALGEQKMKKALGPKGEWVMNALYINMTPIYFFKRLGGVFVDLWDEVRNGQTKYIFNVKKAKNFIAEQIKKYNVNQWYHPKENLKFTTEEGDAIELTMGQAMYLYATWKRETTNKLQDARHLRVGGFVYAKTEENRKLKVDIHHPHALDQADMNKIMAYLGKQGVEFVDEAVRYLSEDMAKLGNETSMERYGYEKFGESYYFPYKVDSDYLETSKPEKKAGQNEEPVSLYAKGLAKKTVVNADKPIILGDFMETWANHVNEMSVFNGFAAAVDNLIRVYNFVTPGVIERDANGNITRRQRKESLSAEIARAHGIGAKQYLADITKSIAGGQIGRSEDTAFMRKMVSKFRKNAVVLSASVAIQQPSAIMRAMAHINPKYFVGAPHSPRKSYQELIQYSGTANVKEMGKFDVGMGQSAKQWILDDLNSDSKLKDAAGKIDNAMGKAPEWMDQMAWASLWEAVKREQKAKNPMMDPNSEAFLQICGKRFDEVVDLTQVYDSVLSRSKIMRSNDGWAQMVTSFMAEPTLTTNMLQDAILNYKENKSTRNHLTVKRAAAVYASSVFFNALLQSLVTAARNDDEEKTYLEKYLAEFTENFMDSINPIGNIPWLQDLLSVFDGYDVERADMALISDLKDALDVVKDENKSMQEKILAASKAIGALFGIPVKNAIREVQAIGNLISTFQVKHTGEERSRNIKYGILEALPFNDLEAGWTTPYYERMLVALQEGDMDEYEELKSYVTSTMGKDDEGVIKGVKGVLKDSVLDGKITEKDAQNLLEKHLGMDSDDAYFQVDKWLTVAKHNDDEDYSYSRFGDIYEAVKAGKSITEASKELTSNGYTMKEIKSEIQSAIGEWYKKGEVSKSEAEKKLAQYTDNDSNEIYWLMDKWDYAKKNGTTDGYGKYNKFYSAVESGTNLSGVIAVYTSHGCKKDTLAGQITEKYKDQYISLYRTNKTAAANLKARLLTAYAALGYDRNKKNKEIDDWLKQKK